MFLAVINKPRSQEVYEDIINAIKRYGKHPIETLSYDQVARKFTELTGVVPIMVDMCHNLCVAFTGPYEKLLVCPDCSASRFKTITLEGEQALVPRKRMLTIPVGPREKARISR
ncbi:hypothetical protein BC834DRAFT_865594 [Gloeopeniophorella convolvens]|nr:hypothetical protein BC834DRAFT_865594 [Gloeopeniophorella convolvens]